MLPVSSAVTTNAQCDMEYHLSQIQHPVQNTDGYSSLSSCSDSSSDSFSNISSDPDCMQCSSDDEIGPVQNVPDPAHLNSEEFRVLIQNSDGANNWDGIWEQAKLRDVHALLIVDAEKHTTHKLLKEKFAHDAAINITSGLSQLFTGNGIFSYF